MATLINYEIPATRQDYLACAEQHLSKLNENFREMTTTEFSEIYEGCKAEVSRLKIEIYALGFGVKRDCTGWRLAI
jgi:hypothetical protein